MTPAELIQRVQVFMWCSRSLCCHLGACNSLTLQSQRRPCSSTEDPPPWKSTPGSFCGESAAPQPCPLSQEAPVFPEQMGGSPQDAAVGVPAESLLVLRDVVEGAELVLVPVETELLELCRGGGGKPAPFPPGPTMHSHGLYVGEALPRQPQQVLRP